MKRIYLFTCLLGFVFPELLRAQSPACGTGLFWSALAASDSTVAAGIGSQNDAAYAFLSNPATENAGRSQVTLPVVVHIIHNNGTENLSDAQVQQAIERLNQAFANEGFFDQGSGVDVPIRFCLATRSPEGGATTGINRVQNPLTNMVLEDDDGFVKNLSRWDPTRYINIWVVRSICSQAWGCGLSGYASFPSQHGALSDGIVLEYFFFNGSPASGSTAPHEMGHYLGLYHTFEGGCTNNDCLADGDRVCDTPPDQSTAPIPCDQIVNSCSTDAQSGLASDLPDATKNFLDYADASCRHDFTSGQSARMEFFVQTARQSLLDSDGCGQPCPALVDAAFSVSAPIVDLGETVNFSNLSQNAASFTWTSNGALFSTSANAAFSFNSIGSFTIELSATSANPNLCPPQTASTLVQVICPVQADFQVDPLEVFTGGAVSVTNTSQGAGQLEWFVNDVSQGAVLDTYTFSEPGAYEIRLEAGNGICSTAKTLVVTVLDSCLGSSFQQYYGTGNDERGVASVVLADGNFLVGGDGAVPGALQEVLFIKTDPDGNVIWSKRFGTPGGSEKLQHLAAQPDGGFVALLSSDTWTGFDDASIASFDAGGQLLWQKRLATPGVDELRRIVATPDGGWIACGYVQPAPPQKASACFIKLDANGNQQWAKAYGAANGDTYATDVAVALDAGYHACGYYYKPNGVRDAMMLELDADGNIVSAQVLDYLSNDRVFWSVKVSPTIPPNLYFSGEETNDPALGIGGIFIRKNAGATTVTGNVFINAGQNTIFSDLKLTSDGQVVIAASPSDDVPQPKAIFLQEDLGMTNRFVQQYAGKGQASIQHVETGPLVGALYTGRSSDGGQQDILLIRANSTGVAGECPQEETIFDAYPVLPGNLNNLAISEMSASLLETTPGMSVADYALDSGAPCAPSCLTPSCKTAWSAYFEDVGSISSLSAITKAPDGTLYAGGWRNNQTLLVNFTPDGKVLWSRQFDFTNRNERLQDLIVDSDGNLLGVGNTDLATIVFSGYAFKYNPVANTVLWVTEEAQSKLSRFTSVQELSPGGNYLIGGSYPTGASSGNPDFDPFLLEMDRNTGNLLTDDWNHAFDFDKNEEMRSVKRKGNEIYAVGRVEFTPPPNSQRSPVIYHADANGNLLELLKLEIASVGTPYLEATDFVFDADSLVICLHGRFDTTPGLLSNQMALVKIAPSGQVIWARRFTINNQNTSSTVFTTQGLVAGADGYYVVTRDFLLKTDLYGRLMWVRHTYGRHDVGRNLAVEQNGSVFLVGKNVNPAGIFLARYQAATGDPGSRCGQDFGISAFEDDLTDISTVPFNWTQYSSPLFMQTNATAPSVATLSDIGYLCNSPCFEICGNGRSDDYDNLSDCVDPTCLCIACNGEQARIWYFGVHAGLDFSTDPPTVLTDGATDSPGATGVMCDAGGRLLLYTDGETIFNRNHQPLPEGSGILGANTSLSNMLIPLSSAVFSLQHANTGTNFNPYYTEIDMNRDQGLGDVKLENGLLQKNQIADLTPVSDKMAATRACTGIESWWVLRKRRNVEQFFVFEINAADNIATQSFTIDIGELDQNGFGNNVIAQMKFNHAGTLLADALPNSAGFDLFEFDPALGGMSTFASIRQNDLAGVYTLEFSPNDRFLYVATPTRLYQYDLQAGSAQAIAQSRVLLANSATPRFGALQTGPNGKIYIATGAGTPADALDVIFQPDQAGAACLYQANAQPLGSGRVRYGLPYIAPGLAVPRERVEIQGSDSLCGLPAQSIYVLKNSALCIGADSIAWELSGGSGGLFNIQNYVVQFQDTGVYRLVAKVWFDCGLKTDTLFVTVTADEDPALNLGPDIKVCENGVFQLDAGAGFERYRWQDGTPEQTLTTSFPGVYWVTVWDACGNTQTDTIKITVDPGTQLDLGPNRVVCRLEGTTFELPDNFESWEWSPGALLGCDTCETIAVYPAAIVNYVVTARNADGCLSTDTVRISPLLLGAVLDTQICRGAALEYLGIPLPNTVDTSFLLDIVTPEGCDLLLTTIIDIFPPVQVQLPADTTLKIGAELALNVLVGSGAAPYQYAWSAPGFLSCDDCPDPVVRPLQAVAYTVVVTDANGCTGSDDIILYVDDSCEVRAPTAFTPDADGTNDTFYLLCDPCVHQVRSLRVWSRWGEEVYLGVNLPPNDAALGWDGRSRNGRAFPSDVLFWSAEVVFFDGRLERFQGELTLIR